ncbi:sensor histidine kinase [Actinophytocola algeriensis]|uniref:histidine kinase n=1 Tax=Actinophytocola algeriensis TaxID=1768010 RepID=A0A7W7VF26_9PSEU|nr:nitrate- and nitrite sensing domain-containing protein [Actinophytocola algeriensis]MBB4907739.1 signal transduction histidine kinase [Actinophytocola algeriensis]MBE1479769.1 signal transduction histidine kinase [Actinophytocola algeriensis]
MSSPHATPPAPSGTTWWTAAVQWRNWPLLVKLGVVLVVPVVGALVLGVLRVRADVELADSYSSIERVAEVREQVVRVLSALQHERNEAVGAGTDLQKAMAATDTAIADITGIIGDTSGDQARIAGNSDYNELFRGMGALLAARGQRAAGGDGLVILSGYNAVTGAVLEFDRSLVGSFPDRNLTNTSLALGELQAVREQVALQQAIGSLALRDSGFSDAGRQLMIEAGVRLEDQLGDFRSVAPPALRERYDTTVTGQDATARQQMVDAARSMGPAQARFTADQWNSVSDTTTSQLSEVTQLAAADLRAGSNDLSETVSDRAGLESVLLLLMVLLAAGIGGGLGRYLLRSLGLLRRAALDVAHDRLPAAVASIRAGETAKVAIDPVPVRTTEEFGQLARAFDAVQEQAIRSAAEEAGLRSNLANIFTNLSRRSQGLVERQLRLMEQLEQKTDDPDQLANLFKIDHLATRMRRNNENLMVLSGTGLLRRFTEPVPLPDVLRAAISEVEHYERAIVRSAPDLRVTGYAAGDLIRSVSELIENATAFSPPDSVVAVESRRRGDGSVMIDVLDDGVGMGEAELREANHRVAGGGGVDVPVSRQMGLFVVGSLTARHDIRVRLSVRAEGGLCASVLVPAGLVGAGDPPGEPALVSVGAASAVVSTGDVAGRLESAGISVTLPDLPSASTPASILFTASDPRPEPGFTWLDSEGRVRAAASPAVAPVTEAGPNGLPKRVPKGQLLVPPARQQPPQPTGSAKRDAARARGFLNGFQSGVRRGETES